MTKAGEREIVKAEHANGGAGYILKEALLTGGSWRTLPDVQQGDDSAAV